jgi:hypothetical protein
MACPNTTDTTNRYRQVPHHSKTAPSQRNRHHHPTPVPGGVVVSGAGGRPNSPGHLLLGGGARYRAELARGVPLAYRHLIDVQAPAIALLPEPQAEEAPPEFGDDLLVAAPAAGGQPNPHDHLAFGVEVLLGTGQRRGPPQLPQQVHQCARRTVELAEPLDAPRGGVSVVIDQGAIVGVSHGDGSSPSVNGVVGQAGMPRS